MLAVGVLAAAAALVLGLRFSVATLVLGSVRSSLDCKCWRRLHLSKSVTSLAACLQRIFPCEPSYLFDRMRMRCVAFRQHISGKIES